jgi:energy-coupling factor transport system ATP-binding protein
VTVRDARRRAADLRAQIGAPAARSANGGSETVLRADRVVVRYGGVVAVREVSLDVHAGGVVAVMGRNGSGKSSLLWALQGTGRRDGGRVEVNATDPAKAGADAARRLVGLVPQTATDLLYLETVEEECAAADRQAAAEQGTCRSLLDRLAPGIDGASHPRDLSEGQRLALVLAVVLSARPPVIALDEPTRGLDYAAKTQLAEVLRALAGDGHAVLVSTHDAEFVALAADRVVVLADGEVVSEGPAAEVLEQSPAFAPQTTKVLGPGWLTVDQVRRAIA